MCPVDFRWYCPNLIDLVPQKGHPVLPMVPGGQAAASMSAMNFSTVTRQRRETAEVQEAVTTAH